MPVGTVPSLDAKYVTDDADVFLTGVQGLVRVVLEQLRADRQAGLDTGAFVSGYQGSPLAGFDREIARRRHHAPEGALVTRPGLNEELAATSVWGTQLVSALPGPRYDGVLGVWHAKAPGLDRAADAIRHGNMVGADPRGGVVAFVGDDPACKSSSLPSASEALLAALHVPTFYPGTLQEVVDFGRHAIACSRVAGTWVALKVVTSVADGAGTARVGAGRITPVVPELEWEGRPYRHTPSARLLAPWVLDAERSLFEARLPLATAYGALNGLDEIVHGDRDAELGLLAAGKTYYELRHALSALGLDEATLARAGVRLLRLGQVFPFPERVVREFARGLREIVVVEEKGPFLEPLVRAALYGGAMPRVVGKVDPDGLPVFPSAGELDADGLRQGLVARLAHVVPSDLLSAWQERQPPPSDLQAAVAARIPFFCSGCPHSRSTQAPDGSAVGVGIGCHTLVLLSPEDRGELVGMTQMGGEGAQWIGIAPFTGIGHFVQNVGDGTFHHSASLAIRAAVAAGVDITYKLLYNGAVAMTGGQDVQGVLGVPELAAWLELEGVRRVIITSDEPDRHRGRELPAIAEVRHRDELLGAQRELAAVKGVTVLIHDQQCAAEKRRLRRRGGLTGPAVRVHINERVCEGCGDCGRKSGCLSVRPVDTPFGRKTQIHQASCNSDFSCLDGDCPSFVTVVGEPAREPRPASAAPPDVGEDPSPDLPPGGWTIRMAGIGGTGVVSMSQILGTAAALDGLHVWNLDQTGLSQKAGPVLSDVHLSARPVAGSNKASRGSADAYLAFDALAAASPQALQAVGAGRTRAVVCTGVVPTGPMVVDPASAVLDDGPALGAIAARVVPGGIVHCDAQAMAERLYGDDLAANPIVLGAAYQCGLLPISGDSLATAFRLNGVEVDRNLEAFAWGRALVAAPEAVAELLRGAAPPADRAAGAACLEALPPGLREQVHPLYAELCRYQHRRYADDFVAAVEELDRAARRAIPAATDLGALFAHHLFRLMAYKDEYEVARLHLDEAEQQRLGALGDRNRVKVYWHLHPPVLRALGLRRKLKLGPWFRPALVVLRSGRVLRGTPLDPFGLARVRRVERRLASEYRALAAAAVERLTPETREAVAEVLELPDLVRGYEHIKLENVRRFRAAAAQALERLELGGPAREPAPAPFDGGTP